MNSKFFRYGKLKMSLRKKLMLVYFLLIVIPLTGFTIYSFNQINSLIQSQTFSAAQKSFDETLATLSNSFNSLETTIDILATEPLTYQISSVSPQNYSYIKQLEDSRQITTTFEQLLRLSNIDRIHLYVKNDYLYSHEQKYISHMEEFQNSYWCDSVYSNSNSNVYENWFCPNDFSDQDKSEQQWFSVMRTIYNLQNINEPLAILRADLSLERIQSSFDKNPITQNSCVMLLRNDEVLLLSDSKKSSDLPQNLVRSISAVSSASWQTVTTNGDQYYVIHEPIDPSGWELAIVIPYMDVYSLSKELQIEMLLVVLILFIVAYFVALLTSKSTLKRIYLLSKTMKSVQNGIISATIVPKGNDEIGQLMCSFVEMMNRIQMLMQEKVKYGKEIKNLELKALQAQINPHFLYNTLDLINCISIDRNVPEISTAVNALAKFYKISLSKGKETIPLSSEFEHTRLYIKIQNMRFENRIRVVWEIDPTILDYTVIKIVIQPIVENAIIHGIFEKPDKTGTITICGKDEGNDILIEIEDNGVGMTQEDINNNFTPSPSGNVAYTAGGYGIHNVNDRLHLAYGDAYGLTCKSIVGKGTKVSLLIPKISPEKENNAK